jgi:protein O-GlcNAc transferase
MDKNLDELFKLLKSKNFQAAEKKCQKIINIIKPNLEIFNIYAVILYEIKKFDEAIKYWKKTISLNENYFFGYNNLGNAYFKINKKKEALENYTKAINIKSDYFEAYHNRANVYFKLKNINAALDDYNSALKIKYDYLPSLKSRAEIFKKRKNFKNALLDLDKILIFGFKDIKTYLEKAEIFFELNKLDLALENYQEALRLDKDPPFVFGNYLLTKTKMCKWINLEAEISKLEADLNRDIKITPPYVSTTLLDSPELQLKCAKLWSNEHKNISNKKFQFIKKKNSKIRLGFFSADLRSHAMGYLMIKMLEAHDKNKFELHAFYFGPYVDEQDAIHKRMLACFDSFNYVGSLANIEIVNLSRKLKIDIALDCMGFTGNENRYGIFLDGVAPIQINYLGYPGTLGSNKIDYIVADYVLIPPESQKFYSEKVIYLPNSYQPNDLKKETLNFNYSKKDFGLPDNSFIFCCFNSNQKLNPLIFKVWIKILKQINNSILWILKDNIFSEQNLKKYTFDQGLDPNRLIFAEHLPQSKHLARLKFADIFLDTYPYNAHTSCSDALKMEIPVITLKGRSFSSRVASSLLTTLDLEELITYNLIDYEKKVLKISSDHNYLLRIKKKIGTNKNHLNLFKPLIYTRNIEKAYQVAYQRYLNNQKAENIFL